MNELARYFRFVFRFLSDRGTLNRANFVMAIAHMVFASKVFLKQMAPHRRFFCDFYEK